MNLTYFKRFKMEFDLVEFLPAPTLPDGCQWLPWNQAILEQHAEVKFQSFLDEIDSSVFPSLGDRTGCSDLMREITGKSGFLPETTWLLARDGEPIGTVQGLCERANLGSIQNLGVLPSQRGQGFGSALMIQALNGFLRAGMARVVLEVTAQNEAAVTLYRKLGFRCRKTVYKAVGPSSYQLLTR